MVNPGEKVRMHNLDFTHTHILVIGDIMLDRFYMGKVNRISPEAPVPILRVTSIQNALGGAGNVVNNTSHLGADTKVYSIAGNDPERKILEDLLHMRNVGFKLFTGSAATTSKIRLIGGHQQIARLDIEDDVIYDPETFEGLCKEISDNMKSTDSVVISDYGKGVCSPELCRFIIQEAEKRKIPIIVDPKGTDWEKYRGATVITPNVKELSAIAGYDIQNTDEQIEKKGKEILRDYGIEALLVTRSEMGMSLIQEHDITHIPTEARDVLDVTGAGDTVVSVIAAALGSGIDILSATKLANIAAGITVGKFGTQPIEFFELHHAVNSQGSSKIVDQDVLLHVLHNAREQQKTVVFTNGCFDILHRGHATYLQEAKKMGDILVIGVNSDDSVKRIKGENRPINNEYDRATLLSSLASVDYVTIFSEDTPYELIKKIAPDVLVKGGDYTEEDVVGREFTKKVELVPFVKGYSTTKSIEKMKEGTC